MKPETPPRAPHARKTERSGKETRPAAKRAPRKATGRATAGRAEPQPAPAPRRPQQERGLRRVDAILDAAAALITTDGIAGVTMHRVAQHSGTTIGSMYHFFPDREAVLRALAERHTEQLRTLITEAEREGAARWSQLSTAEAVDRYLDPFLRYVDHHPDLLPLGRFARASGWTAHRSAEMDRLIIQQAEAVIASRVPDASRAELTTRAVTMTAMVEGVMGAAARQATPARSAPSVAAIRQELRRALVAYLDSYASPADGATHPTASPRSRPARPTG